MRLPFILMCSAVLMTACTPLGLATGAAATAGMAAVQEGGISRAYSDAKIQATINDLWIRYDLEAFRKLDMTVNQGRVLITGVVQKPEQRVEAVRLAWQPEGVKQVINEVRVAKSPGIIGFARDSWISTRLRTAITLDKNVQSINYTIDTVQGTVYLMGAAQNQAELNRVIETARTIPDVRQVVSYVRIIGEADQQAGQSSSYNSTDYSPAGQSDTGYDYNNTYGTTGSAGSDGNYNRAVTPAPQDNYSGGITPPPASSSPTDSGPILIRPVESEPL